MSASVAGTQATSGGYNPATKKKVDDRIKFLIEDCAHRKHRSIFLLVGDRGKDQIVNIHAMASRAMHTSKLSLLWCMKAEPDFGSTSRKKQERVARLEVKGGMSTETTKETFQTFLSQTQIRFCQYKESHKVLGQTFGMAVLQDFEAMTPNVLARTIETVAGGGVVVVMLRAMRSLRQLYTIAMDVHSRFRSEGHRDVTPRFNERFILSLADCSNVLCVDDDLNVLPFTEKMKSLGAEGGGHRNRDAELAVSGSLQHEAELAHLKEKLKVSKEVGPLVDICSTMDQAKTVLSLMQSVTEKTLNATCVVTAARGRGKSAALGLAAAGAVAQGYSNIFCTAPTPDNLQTFFEFVVNGLQRLGYRERFDFAVMLSTNPEYAKCTVRVNIFKEHRQTVQFVSATDSALFAQAELLIIDEAAAIPLPVVKKMLGPYLIFLSSTISGYEGTGRSLSMKLVADMRKHNGVVSAAGSGGAASADALPGQSSTLSSSSSADRRLVELALSDPIRYGPNDPVEKWLNGLLCLDATKTKSPVKQCHHPSACELYYVNRDALFSYHPTAERLLQNVVSLLVAAHYKNQPNDIQLMSDAPGHHLFILCAPVDLSAKDVPDVFCVIHCCEEGGIASESLSSNISKGLRPSGDLIPYTLAQYYMEEGFAKLRGMRVIRIATNPDFQRAGYGTQAIKLLTSYFAGNINVTAADEAVEEKVSHTEDTDDNGTMVSVRKRIPTLLTPIVERPFELLDYVGVSFGVTTELFTFWKRAGFEPLYLRQVPNELTGEHSCVMIRSNDHDLSSLKREFHSRFLSLLPMSFRNLPLELALSIAVDVDAQSASAISSSTVVLTSGGSSSTPSTSVFGVPQARFSDFMESFSASDLRRLKLCATTYVDNSVIMDLVPKVARWYFEKRFFKTPRGADGVVLAHTQAAVLLGIGLQCHSLDDLAASALFSGVQPQQVRAFLNKAMSRIVEHLHRIQTEELDLAEQQQGEQGDGGRVGAKRPRSADASELSVGGAEQVSEQRDASGNVIGISVARRVAKPVNVDATLIRDARNTSTGIAESKPTGVRLVKKIRPRK